MYLGGQYLFNNNLKQKIMSYKVRQEDLIGEIKHFPIEVVRKMVEKQVEYGSKADVTVFQKNKFVDDREGGY